MVPPYVLKNRSKFDDPGESARVPFWPVGWTKQKQAAIAVAVAAAPKLAFDPKSFHVTSILIGGGTSPSLAVINDRAYAEGEFLRMPPKGSQRGRRIRVERITDGTVTLEHEDQKIVVPLRRQELNQHKPDDDPNCWTQIAFRPAACPWIYASGAWGRLRSVIRFNRASSGGLHVMISGSSLKAL